MTLANDMNKATKAVIRSAYAALANEVECHNHSMKPRLEFALAYERKGRTLDSARALIVEQARKGCLDAMCERIGAMPIDLYDISLGLAVAHMVGAAIGREYLQRYPHAPADIMKIRARIADFIALASASDAAWLDYVRAPLLGVP